MELDDLIQNVHDFFLSQYNGSLDGTDTFLSFEPLGLMISPDDFQFNGAFNATVAQQQVSVMADIVPAIGDVFEPDAINKISDQYGQLVGDGAGLTGTLMFCSNNIDPSATAQYMALFGNLKTNAQQKFAQSGEEASILDPTAQVASCTATPGTWYDTTSPIWQQKTFQGGTTPATPPPAGRPAFAWKLTPDLQKIQPASPVHTLLLTHLNIIAPVKTPPPAAAAATPPPATGAAKPPPAPVHIAMERTIMPVKPDTPPPATTTPKPAVVVATPVIAHAVIAQPAPVTPTINKTSYLALRSTVPFAQMVALNRVIGLNSNAVTQPVNSSQFTIDFSYSLVMIERDWLYEPLFDKASLWYSLTNKAGDYSTGENSADNKGLLRCIPKAMIVIKDLNISAQWSAADMASAASSYGFGCFNISNSPAITTANNQLAAPGIQVIAWVCEVLPKLPVNDDPGMAGASSTTSAASSANGQTAQPAGTSSDNAAVNTPAAQPAGTSSDSIAAANTPAAQPASASTDNTAAANTAAAQPASASTNNAADTNENDAAPVIAADTSAVPAASNVAVTAD